MMLDEMEAQQKIARENDVQIPDIRLIFKQPGQNLDPNRYNLPRSNEIAVVFVPGADNEAPQTKIAVRKGGQLKMLSSTDPLIDRLVRLYYSFVIIFIFFRYIRCSFHMVNLKDGVHNYIIHLVLKKCHAPNFCRFIFFHVTLILPQTRKMVCNILQVKKNIFFIKVSLPSLAKVFWNSTQF